MASTPDSRAACQAAKPSHRKTCCARSMERTVSAKLQYASPWPPTNLDSASCTVPTGSALLMGAPQLPNQKGCVTSTVATLDRCAAGKLAALPLLKPEADARNITRSGCALMKNAPPTHSKRMGTAGSMAGTTRRRSALYQDAAAMHEPAVFAGSTDKHQPARSWAATARQTNTTPACPTPPTGTGAEPGFSTLAAYHKGYCINVLHTEHVKAKVSTQRVLRARASTRNLHAAAFKTCFIIRNTVSVRT